MLQASDDKAVADAPGDGDWFTRQLLTRDSLAAGGFYTEGMRTMKLVCVGLGHVGSYVLSYAMESGLFAEIATIDTASGVAYGEALDQSQSTGVPGTDYVNVHEGTYEDCADADVIIVAAGASIVPDPDHPEKLPDRASLAALSAGVVNDVVGNIVQYTREAIVIFITNPLDAVVHLAHSLFDYPTNKLFGTGTMLDSSRLRWIVGKELGIDPKSVTGYMMGEHGFTAVPVLSTLNVQGVGWKDLEKWHGSPLPTPEQMQERVVGAAYDVLNSKGWTNAGVARSALHIARAVVLDQHSVHPVCTFLDGEYGLEDVSLSMPAEIAGEGIVRRLPPKLNDWEMTKLHQSAEYIRQTVKTMKDSLGATH